MCNFYTQEKEFVPIKGYEHEYSIDKQGRILSKLTDIYVRQRVDKHGYLIVTLMKDGHKSTHRVHVLVAEHFIPNPNNLPLVNHIDGNKQNPNHTNLEWATYSENTQHAHDTGLQKKTSNKVVVRGDGVAYESLTAAASANKITKSAISKVINGKRKTAAGYTWKLQ